MRWMVALALVSSAAPGLAQEEDPLAPVLTEPPPVVAPAPRPPVVRVVPRDWRGVFDAIRGSDWIGAKAGIDALGNHVLRPVALAELYTARGSPAVELPAILALLAEAPDLPQAGQLQRLAIARGALETPRIAAERRMVPLGAAPRRHRSSPVVGDLAADALRTALEPLVKVDSAVEAEALYTHAAPTLTEEARAEAAQRVAWIYYVLGQDAEARRIAEDGLAGGAVGEWAAQANWIAGLASWRGDDCNAAARHFRAVAYGRAETELAAAGAYWAARSEMACRRPQLVEPLMRAAARSVEGFYGLVARRTLGLETRLPALNARDSARVEALPNVRRAAELVRIGDSGLAETHLRHQGRIGNSADHVALIAHTQRSGFAGVQYWLAHNGPQGVSVPGAARFPLPGWQPSGGWRIEPSLAFAHGRQESDFRIGAVSPAGAVGLMQVRPGTAGDFARRRGVALGNLREVATNLEYGQSFIELMRSSAYTQGQLLKVMAAYNAGPVPVSRWNYINDKGDPLLWVESLPYWETRYYVPAVLRNMWVYEGLAGAPQPSLKSIAEHKWPAFPVARAGSSASSAR